MISVLALDIDGVLTNGKVILDQSGQEFKSLSYQDIDAVYLAKRNGLQIVLITGETTPWVDVVAKRLEVTHVFRGAKDKGKALKNMCEQLNVDLTNVCYVGDSLRDIDALTLVGLGLAPANANKMAQNAADRVLSSKGGDGAVAEAVEIILHISNGFDEKTQANKLRKNE